MLTSFRATGEDESLQRAKEPVVIVIILLPMLFHWVLPHTTQERLVRDTKCQELMLYMAACLMFIIESNTLSGVEN